MLDHVLDHARFGHVLVILVVKEFFGLVLLFLGIAHLLLYPFFMSHLVIHDLLSLFLLLGHVHHRLLRLFVYALLQPHLLFLLCFHVPFSLLDNLTGLLAGLVYFFVSPNFFLFQ